MSFTAEEAQKITKKNTTNWAQIILNEKIMPKIMTKPEKV